MSEAPERLPAERRTAPSRWRTLRRVATAAVAGFGEDHCGSMAAALAFYAAFSLAPMLRIVIASSHRIASGS